MPQISRSSQSTLEISAWTYREQTAGPTLQRFQLSPYQRLEACGYEKLILMMTAQLKLNKREKVILKLGKQICLTYSTHTHTHTHTHTIHPAENRVSTMLWIWKTSNHPCSWGIFSPGRWSQVHRDVCRRHVVAETARQAGAAAGCCARVIHVCLRTLAAYNQQHHLKYTYTPSNSHIVP